MSMNKKIITCILFIFSFFLFSNTVLAETTTTTSVVCNNINSETACNLYGKCKWTGGVCQEQNVAVDPCNQSEIRTVLRFFGYFLSIAKLAVPLIIIVMGTIDLYKSVIDKDEKSVSKQLRVLGIRIIIGIFVFFIPTLVNVVFSFSVDINVIDSDKYSGCATCLLKPGECNVSDN